MRAAQPARENKSSGENLGGEKSTPIPRGEEEEREFTHPRSGPPYKSHVQFCARMGGTKNPAKLK